MHGLFYINIIYLISAYALTGTNTTHDLWVRGVYEIRVPWQLSIRIHHSHKRTDFHATFKFIFIIATSAVLRAYTLRPHYILLYTYFSWAYYTRTWHDSAHHYKRLDTANILPLNMRKLNMCIEKKNPNSVPWFSLHFYDIKVNHDMVHVQRIIYFWCVVREHFGYVCVCVCQWNACV